jgi:hypothetical protein
MDEHGAAQILSDAANSEKVKAMKTDDFFVELLTLVREIHAMLKGQEVSE